MPRSDNSIKSVVTRKPVIERLTIRVLKAVDVEELLKETGGILGLEY